MREGPEPTRPVWLSAEQRAELARIYALQPPTVICQIVAAWDAAPENATEAIAKEDKP